MHDQISEGLALDASYITVNTTVRGYRLIEAVTIIEEDILLQPPIV